jgi:hypothetical protein
LAKSVQSRLSYDLLQENDHSTLFSFLLDQIEKLAWINDALNEKLVKSYQTTVSKKPDISTSSVTTAPKPYSQCLYQIACHNVIHQHHGNLYLDQPKMLEIRVNNSSRMVRKLQAREQVYEIETYLKENPGISFVVLKSVLCDWDASYELQYDTNPNKTPCSCRNCVQMEMRTTRAQSSLQKERIRIVSPDLKKALRRLGKCRMDGLTVGPNNDPQMIAPYLFLYHHRSEIVDALKEIEDPVHEHLELLRSYIDINFGKEYEEADELFKAGMVSGKQLSKLFKPNQVVISEEDGEPVAHVIHWWPHSKDDSLYIKGWSWEFDGFTIRRVETQIALEYDTDKNIPIKKLKYFPAEYAEPQCVNGILDRGKKYWGMRERYFASYSGWDAHRDYFYVSIIDLEIKSVC